MAQVKEGVSLTHAYKHHKEKKKKKQEPTVDMKTFKDVCYLFNKKLVKKVVSGFHTQLPHRMGFIRIIRKKGKVDKMAINFKATKEHGFTIYHDNRHSDGWYGEWSWRKPNHVVKNMIHYSFKPTREMCQMITEVFTDGNKYKRYVPV